MKEWLCVLTYYCSVCVYLLLWFSIFNVMMMNCLTLLLFVVHFTCCNDNKKDWGLRHSLSCISED